MTDIDTSNFVIWPKWCYSNSQMENEAQNLVLNNNNSISNNNNNNNNNNNSVYHKDKDISSVCGISRSRKKPPPRKDPPRESSTTATDMPADANAGNVKAERLSPEGGAEGGVGGGGPQARHASPAPSTSPKSPGAASHRTRTPSFPGTPPNPAGGGAFTPPTTALHSPYDRFSPAALGAAMGGTHGQAAIKQMEGLMTRNCSDLMRSLAAKYNNSNPNDYFSSPNNGFLRAPLSNITPFKGAPSPFLGVNSPPNVSCATSIRDPDKKNDPPVSTVTAGIPPGIPPHGTQHLFPGPGIPGFPGFPLVDMSSTQVLLNMVRNASAAQQSQLENYLRGAMKRPADAPTSPLDLSSSVGAHKRPRTDVSRSFDVKNLFPTAPEEDKKCVEEKGTVLPSTPSPTVTKARTSSPPTAPVAKQPAGIPCNDRNCPSFEGVLHWTVEDVCSFVGSIDLCAEYIEAFREQRIDGSALPLLTEEHLTTSINMKLGPALKLRAILARKLGSCNICLHCSHCHSLPLERRPNSASSGQ